MFLVQFVDEKISLVKFVNEIFGLKFDELEWFILRFWKMPELIQKNTTDSHFDFE
jgi:hypothetical protein